MTCTLQAPVSRTMASTIKVLAEIEQALGHHELIKVKIASEDRETKALIVEAIVRFTQSCVGIEDILSVAARFYALALGGTEPAFYR
jgi:hypothetical protein